MVCLLVLVHLNVRQNSKIHLSFMTIVLLSECFLTVLPYSLYLPIHLHPQTHFLCSLLVTLYKVSISLVNNSCNFGMLHFSLLRESQALSSQWYRIGGGRSELWYLGVSVSQGKILKKKGKLTFIKSYYKVLAFQVALVVKNPPANAGDARDVGLIPGQGRSPGGGNDNPLKYSCLENSTDRGAWWESMQLQRVGHD